MISRQNEAVERLDPQKLVGRQILRILRQKIIRVELMPGTRLTEQEIASQYEISRHPVRETFIKLAKEGLLEVLPQRGTFVSRISVGGVMDGRFAREAIEADIVRLLAKRAEPAVIDELRAQVALQRESLSQDVSSFMQLDENFHRTLADRAGKTRVWGILEDVKAQMDRVRYFTVSEFPSGCLIEQHHAVVEAIADRNPDAAEAAMRGHMRNILEDLPAIIAAHPTYFEPIETAIE